MYRALALMMLCFPAIAHTQRANPIAAGTRVSEARDVLHTRPGAAAAQAISGNRVLARSFVGLLGAGAGMLAGGFVGYHVLSHDCGGCDDPGLSAMITGAAFGTFLGGSIAASGPRLASECSGGHRIGRGLLGGFLGAALGAGVGFASNSGAPAIVLLPVGTAAGAALATETCRAA